MANQNLQRKGGLGLNDINKMTLREREIQQYLLKWLLNHGRDKVRRNRIWNQSDWHMEIGRAHV